MIFKKNKCYKIYDIVYGYIYLLDFNDLIFDGLIVAIGCELIEIFD